MECAWVADANLLQMSFNFDEIIERRGTNSMKWSQISSSLPDADTAPLPMWVADMDFRVAPPIQEALEREVKHGIFGYCGTPESYIDAVIGWQQRRFHWQARPEWLVRMPGVITAVTTSIQAFSHPGDHVLVQPPVYHHFLNDVVINGRRLAEAPLIEENGRYRFDPVAFEAAIRPNTRLFILCNPHNPTGNVWSREELTTMATICKKHGIIVVSDEIHQDLLFDRTAQHTSWGTLGEEAAQNAVICTAPSKSFNLAGLQCANIFIPNPHLRSIFQAQRDRAGLFLNSTMGTAACEAAYRHGEPWLEAMLDYVAGNHRYLVEEISRRGLPLTVTPTRSLYLAWIDCRQLGMPAEKLNHFLLRRARLWLDDGRKFGAQGHGFMRINLACSRKLVVEAMERLSEALRQINP